MDREDLRDLIRLADRRDELRFAWLRWLLMLASGSLAILVTLRQEGTLAGIPGICMRGAWLGLGAGVLFGAIALYGEVWTAIALVRNRRRQLLEPSENTSASTSEPTIATPPPLLRICEPLCYTCFLASVLSLVAYAVLVP